MQETPKRGKGGKGPGTEPDVDDTGGRDDETGGYYYDDAHGYEYFDPEKDVGDDDEDEGAVRKDDGAVPDARST